MQRCIHGTCPCPVKQVVDVVFDVALDLEDRVHVEIPYLANCIVIQLQLVELHGLIHVVEQVLHALLVEMKFQPDALELEAECLEHAPRHFRGEQLVEWERK